MRNERGIFDPITWFGIVMAMMLVGGLALIFGVESEPPAQKSIVAEYGESNIIADPQGPHNQGANQ